MQVGIRFDPLVGLASYSIYLWHWPLIVLTREGSVFLPFSRPQSLSGKLILAFLSLMLGFLSWRFIEQPFRKPSRDGSVSSVVRTGAFAAVALCAIAGLIVTFSGFPARFSPRAEQLASFTNYDAMEQYRRGTCFIDSSSHLPNFDKQTCLPNGPGSPRILLIGDSHAAHLCPGLRAVMPGAAIAQITASGCRPLVKQPIQAASRCIELMNFGFDEATKQFKPDDIILAGNWQPGDIPALPATLAALRARAKKLILVGPMPHYTSDVPKLLAVAEIRHDPGLLPKSLLRNYFMMDHEMASIAAAGGVQYLSPIVALCRPTCVTLSHKQEPIQFDESHLTLDGSRMLIEQWLASSSSPL